MRVTDRSYRLAALGCLAILVPLGLALKLYRGAGQSWLNDSFGGVPWMVAWMLLVAACWPRLSPLKNGLAVLVVTCALECLQLWHPPFLERLRAGFVGRTLLGNTFAWTDFPYYVIGAVVGIVVLRGLRARWLPG